LPNWILDEEDGEAYEDDPSQAVNQVKGDPQRSFEAQAISKNAPSLLEMITFDSLNFLGEKPEENSWYNHEWNRKEVCRKHIVNRTSVRITFWCL
jgi:hypothetical protein